MRRVGETSETD